MFVEFDCFNNFNSRSYFTSFNFQMLMVSAAVRDFGCVDFEGF